MGLLHLEVFSQRLQQEYAADPILTAPSVTYKVKLRPTKETIKSGKDEFFINNPAHFPDHMKILETYEPVVTGELREDKNFEYIYFFNIINKCITQMK